MTQNPSDDNDPKRGLRFWLRVYPSRPVVDNPRLWVVLQIEWALLALRYLMLFVIVGAYALGIFAPYSPDLRIAAVAAILHNTFAHWVLNTERYYHFLRPINFWIHLLTVSVAVGLTGGESSPIALLYVLFIIGYCAYSPNLSRPLAVSLACCGAYCFTVLARWFVIGMNLEYPPVGLHLFVLLLCGWLVRSLGESLRRLQIESQEKAEALASSQAMLRTILDSVGHPIMVHDENELICDVNDRACEYLGMPRSQLIGQRFRMILFDDGTLPQKLSTLWKRGKYQGEMLVLMASGEERTVDLLARSFLRDGQRFFVSMIHDITEQKNIQETSRQATVKLEQINRELQRVGELRTAFFMTVSQRLRSPISALMGFVDMLLGEELGVINEEQRKALQSCRRSILRVFQLVDEQQELDRGSSGGPVLPPDTTESGQWIAPHDAVLASSQVESTPPPMT